MRAVAYLLICLGVLLLFAAAYGEHRGVAVASAPTELQSIVHTAKRAENPEEFRNLMTYQWIESGLVLFAGLLILGAVRRADTLDPFSHSFGGSQSIDDLELALNQEEERRKRPLKR